MSEAHAAIRKDLLSATGSSSFASSAATASGTGWTVSAVSPLASFSFSFSSSEPSTEGSRAGAAGWLIARVASKSKFSGH